MAEKPNFEVWPGPMEGVAGEIFTVTVNRLGLVDRWMTPFLRVGDAVPREKIFAAFLRPFLEGGVPVTAQLMGTCGRVLGESAAQLLKQGAAEINLNCGCPSRRVISHGGGGGALRDPEKLSALLKEMSRAAGDVRISVKMRCGFASFDETCDIICRLNDTGVVSKYFIHFRTVAEGYAAVPGREERLRTAAAAAGDIPVVVNGDIVSAEDGIALAAAIGAAGVMAARGWMRDPWLLKRLAGAENVPSPEEGRKLFFAGLRHCGLTGGNIIEAARMLWGVDSAEFRQVIAGRFDDGV